MVLAVTEFIIMARIEALTPLAQEDLKQIKLCVFDIETIRWKEPYAVGFYDGDIYKVFEGRDCIKQAVKFVVKKKYRGYHIFAHNGGKFDFLFMLDELLRKAWRNDYVLKPMRRGSSILRLDVQRVTKKEDGTIKVHDSWKFQDSVGILPNTLKNLAIAFDVDNKKGDFEHKKINWRNWKKLRPEWFPYLENDCKGLYQIIRKYEAMEMKESNIDIRKVISVASGAMRSFRRNNLDCVIPQYKGIEANIRKAYFGGRCEIFKLFGTDLKFYDVNSEYPAVMENELMPVGVPVECSGFNIEEDLGIAEVEVTTPKYMKYPLLPKRCDKTGKLFFPLGTWKGWYCSPELIKAKQLGYKIEVLRGYRFKGKLLFKDYIDHWYKIKSETKDPAMRLLAKLKMNSLYGKFGQKRDREKVLINPQSTIGLTPLDESLPIYTKTIESDSCHILPAISAFVCSYARLLLYDYIEQVVAKGGEIYYCDTDSLVTNVELPTSNELGAMKLEMNIEKAVFLLPKFYGIKRYWYEVPKKDKQYLRTKGFPKGLFEFDNFKEALDTDDYSKFKYKQEVLSTAFESLRRNNKVISMIKKTRSIVSKYDKRVVTDGFDTEALKIVESIV